MPQDVLDPNGDVTEASGYNFEASVKQRLHNGWGRTQTRLPKGHLARRDAEPAIGTLKATDDDGVANS